MDVMTEQMWFVRSVLDDLPEWMDGADALRLTVRTSGNRICLYQGDSYIWEYARRQGWYIPSYPMDPSGQIREFFADQGVNDVPQWYRKLGIDDRLYRNLYRYRLLVAMNERFQRQALPLPAHLFDDFCDIDRQAQAELLDTARFALDFALGRTDEVRTAIFK